MVLGVANQKPTARLLLPVITDAEEDDKVQFSASGEDTESDRDFLNFTWDISGRSYYGASFSLAFTSAGQKKFTLIVIDPEGARDTVNGTILIRNPAPWVTGSVYPDRFNLNGSLNYTASAGDTASDARTLFVLWEFGDNTTSMEPNGTHAYSAPGSYLVRLSVMDDEGAKAERSFTVQVLPQVAPPPKPKPNPPASSVNWVYPSLAVLGAVLLIVAIAISFRIKKSAPPPSSSSDEDEESLKADKPSMTGKPSKADKPTKTKEPSKPDEPSKAGKSKSSKEEKKPPTDSSEE
jgi:PKD repeat protein